MHWNYCFEEKLEITSRIQYSKIHLQNISAIFAKTSTIYIANIQANQMFISASTLGAHICT